MREMQYTKLRPDAIQPQYAHEHDAGADLFYCGDTPIFLAAGERRLIPTGIAIAMPSHWVGLIHPRSGLAHKDGVTVLNAPGTVDSSYRGEIKVNLINLGYMPVRFDPGFKIAQIVFQEFKAVEFIQVSELDETERGLSGHGSTGSRIFDGRI